MRNSTKWIYVFVGGVMAVGLIAGAGFIYARSEASGLRDPSNPGFGWFGDGDHPIGAYDEALAEALGITVDELHAAFDAIWEANIRAAVEQGRLTAEQADEILSHPALGLRIRRGPLAQGEEMNALLAAELGIPVAKLEAAQEEAHENMLEDVIASGKLSAEQAELMRAHKVLAPYMQSAMDQAFEQAVADALSDSAITQSQADLLLENGKPGMRMFSQGPGARGQGGRFPGGRFFGTDEG